jgi:hypothetical protein
VASIEEVKAEAGSVIDRLRQMIANCGAMQQEIEEIGGSSARILRGSGRDEASAALSRITSTHSSFDDARANAGIAVEQLEQLIAAL